MQPKTKLTLRKFKIRVLVVPSHVQTLLFGEQQRVEEREIEGYTLADAKRRAGIR
jgi:hypothetical protein